jgi:ABC-type lipoprotein release transport system permease subunit
MIPVHRCSASLPWVSARRRRGDFAILKTLGLLRRQLSAITAWQVTTLTVLALIAGLPLGVETVQTVVRRPSPRSGFCIGSLLADLRSARATALCSVAAVTRMRKVTCSGNES